MPAVAAWGFLIAFTVLLNLASAQPWSMSSFPFYAYYSHIDGGGHTSLLAASADGSKLVAAGLNSPSPIYVSTNAGATWIQTSAPSNYWSAVASSADGTKLVATTWDYSDGTNSSAGSIFTSHDSGVTWVLTSAPSNDWASVASSADGTKLVAAPVASGLGSAGFIYTSRDAGVTWRPASAPSNSWSSVASSADGRILFATGSGGIYSSQDSGASWALTGAGTNVDWGLVHCSADGTRLAAVGEVVEWVLFVPELWTSTDMGITWKLSGLTNESGFFLYDALVMSADGATIVAATEWWDNGYYDYAGIYLSTNAGATWTRTAAPISAWSAAAASADGQRIAVVSTYGWLFSLPYSGPWRLADTRADNLSLLASSRDGSKLIAAGVRIFSSSDSGSTWTATASPTNAWRGLAASADGTRLVAVAGTSGISDGSGNGDGLIYTSTNAGASWTPASAPRADWSAVASSADGTKMVAAVGSDGLIYTSSDAGATWHPTSSPRNDWSSIASSADGSKLFAAAFNGDGSIYISKDAGASWGRATLPTNEWVSVACSADGNKLVAAFFDNSRIYTSSDAGATWSQTSLPAADAWSSVAASEDGATLVATSGLSGWPPPSGLSVYISTNSGATWFSANAPAGDWHVVNISANAGNIVVLSSDGLVYGLHLPAPPPQGPPSPPLSICQRGSRPILSWVLPSTPFKLQQSADLNSTDWIDVTTPPSVNSTNLHYQYEVPLTSDHTFYRLKQQ